MKKVRKQRPRGPEGKRRVNTKTGEKELWCPVCQTYLEEKEFYSRPNVCKSCSSDISTAKSKAEAEADNRVFVPKRPTGPEGRKRINKKTGEQEVWCSSCLTYLGAKEFYETTWICKSCTIKTLPAKYAKIGYHAHKNQTTKVWRNRYRQSERLFAINSVLSPVCRFPGCENSNPRGIDLHHMSRFEKKGNVCTTTSKISLVIGEKPRLKWAKVIVEEASKCIPVCAYHHKVAGNDPEKADKFFVEAGCDMTPVKVTVEEILQALREQDKIGEKLAAEELAIELERLTEDSEKLKGYEGKIASLQLQLKLAVASGDMKQKRSCMTKISYYRRAIRKRDRPATEVPESFKKLGKYEAKIAAIQAKIEPAKASGDTMQVASYRASISRYRKLIREEDQTEEDLESQYPL